MKMRHINPVLLALIVFSLGGLSIASPVEEPSAGQRSIIPEDLMGAIKLASQTFDAKILQELKNSEENKLFQYHMSLGMAIRNTWIRPKDSPLKKWFTDRQIFHPDEMSNIVITSLWRSLNSLPLGVDAQLAKARVGEQKIEKEYIKDVKNSKASDK